MEVVTTCSPRATRLPSGCGHGERTNDDEVPRALVLKRLLEGEADDRSKNGTFKRAQSPSQYCHKHFGGELQLKLVTWLDGRLTDGYDCVRDPTNNVLHDVSHATRGCDLGTRAPCSYFVARIEDKNGPPRLGKLK